MYNVSQGVFYNGVQSVSPPDDVTFVANNGLSNENGDYVLGQAVGNVDNPAVLLDNRQIPLAGNTVEFSDDNRTSLVTIGRALVEIDSNDAAAGQPTATLRFLELGPDPVLFELSASRFAGGAMVFDMAGTGNGGILLFNSGNTRLTNFIGDGDNGQILQVIGKTGVRGASALLNFPNTAAQSSSDLTIALSGAVPGDMVWLGFQPGAVVANTCYTAWVSAADVVTVRFNNYSAAAVNPAAVIFSVYAAELI